MVYIINHGIINIAGGTISTRGYGIQNNDIGTINMTGGSIHSTGNNGIYNGSTGTVNVSGGSIVADKYAAIYNNSTGSIIVGEKDGIVSTEIPYIKGTYGVYNSKGTFKFYDGILIGNENQSIYGKIAEIEEGYDVVKTINEDSTESATLQVLPVARIVSTGAEYITINEAIAAVEENTSETIQILRNIEILETSEKVVIGQNKDITLDINGVIIQLGKEEFIENNGKLKLVDSSEGEVGIIKTFMQKVLVNNENAILTMNSVNILASTEGTNSERKTVIDNKGDMIIEGGNITSEKSYCNGINSTGNIVMTGGKITTNNNYAYGINSSGKVEMSGGTITHIGNTSYSYIGACIISSGEVIISGGMLTTKNGDARGIYNTGNVKILDGQISTNGYASHGIQNMGTLEISGGKITAGHQSGYGIYNTGTINYINGEIEAEAAIRNDDSGTIIIENAIINSVERMILSFSTGDITINGGTFKSEEYECIDNNSTGNIIINGGIFKNEKNYPCIGNYKTATVTINGGTIESTNNYGIKNADLGTIIIGNKESEYNISNPTIIGATYGIWNNSGVFEFYNGSITGALEKSIEGIITTNREGYNIVVNTNEDGITETAILSTENVARIISTGEEFISLKSAIDSVIDSKEEEIQIINNIRIPTLSEQMEISENKNIIIDLNGKKIMSSKASLIQNKGILKLKDNTEEKLGGIVTYKDEIINNFENASLEIKDIYLKSGFTGGGKIIENDGNIYMYSGNISSINSNIKGIINNVTGTTMIYGGSINVTRNDSICIKNSGILEIIDGNVEWTKHSDWYGKAIQNDATGVCKIKGGNVSTYSGSSYAYAISNVGKLEITGGTITSDGNGIYNSGTIQFSNGKIIGDDYGIKNYGNFEMSGGIVEMTTTFGNKHAILNYSNIKITGGTIISSNYGIVNYENGLVEMNGGAIQMECDGEGLGILSYGELIIAKAQINVSCTNSNSRCYGIDLADKAKLTLGVKDRNVSNTLVTINSSKYGIYISNDDDIVVNMYDGTIIGNTKAIYGEIDEVEEGYELNIVENETKAYLIISGSLFENVASIGKIYYNTLKEAVNAIETEGTIKIENEIQLIEPITITTGKNITIDLHGCIISGNNIETVIIVESGATLTIIDSEEIGTTTTLYAQIENTTGTVIKNQGTLNIGTNDGIVYTNSPRITGITAIENTGELHIYDGTVGTITGSGTKEDLRN